jgi:hypothetical protein
MAVSPKEPVVVSGLMVDKELFQIALRALQQVNKGLPVASEDAETLTQAAPQAFSGLPIDQIAVEIIQSRLRKKPL